MQRGLSLQSKLTFLILSVYMWEASKSVCHVGKHVYEMPKVFTLLNVFYLTYCSQWPLARFNVNYSNNTNEE